MTLTPEQLVEILTNVAARATANGIKIGRRMAAEIAQRHEVCDAMVKTIKAYDKYVYEACADK